MVAKVIELQPYIQGNDEPIILTGRTEFDRMRFANATGQYFCYQSELDLMVARANVNGYVIVTLPPIKICLHITELIFQIQSKGI